ncbi:DUF1631 family protein [Pseudomonas aeruginosa]
MQNDANVVHLTRVASEPSPNAGAGRLPVILVQVRDKAALQLKQALQALFDNADDTLFEMADRATSNLEQNAFFEAMRDLRLKRKSIERVYLQKVFEEFSALNQVQSGKSVPTLDTVSFDSLSLVQNEELEESVAVDAMVARVMSRDATALAHLSTRLNTLVGRKVDEKSNPLAPRPLTAAFLDACQGLGVEIKVKLIILKLFEKYVLAHCDQLYAEANQILVAAGVLPELKSALPRRQPAVRPEAVRDAGTLQAQAALLDGGQQEVFGALQELLAQVRDNPSFYRRETPENAAPISSNDLMRLLSHLQQHLPGPGAAEFDVRDGVDQLLQRVSQTVGEVERQTLRVESVSAESNQAVAGQRSQIEQVATAMNQMAATAQEVARSAAMAVSSANSVNQETLSGRSLVESQVGSIQRLAGEIDQSVAAINRLASDSASISQVLDVIKGIAEQTNLLALNAAIEAARAGEQGRGFAVVADEVRTLAKRTQQSTAEIEQMILRLQGGVDAAVKAMGSSHHTADGTVNESAQVQQALENILGAVGMIVDQNQQIAAAAEQQTAVAHDIDQNIVEINQAGERTAEGASQTERASRELGAQVTQLKRLIGAFRV